MACDEFLNFESVVLCESRPRGLSVPLPPMLSLRCAQRLARKTARARALVLTKLRAAENGRGAAVATRYFTRIRGRTGAAAPREHGPHAAATFLSLIHISEPTRPY